MIYLKSFQLSAPFNNKGLFQLCATFLAPYLQNMEFIVPEPKQKLRDGLSSYSNSFEERSPGYKLGKYTLADFDKQTRIGDNSEICIFYIISLDKTTVDNIAKGAYAVCEKVIENHGTSEDNFRLKEIMEAMIPLEGTVTEKMSYDEKVGKWADLLNNFPYGDKIYQWLLNNRHYPQMVVLSAA